ncbi:MAG: SGNH/GDSL hydrolase family protein [Lachnospiraceae bacterium]|nr:SGNH/GDSL hydrolase family protein [Lachnospiraceae bacterium]
MKKGEIIFKTGITLVIVVGVLCLLQRLLVPKYVDGIVEGAFVAEYYQEKNKEFDVVFIGDCEVYENFSPVTLWEEYGINSYIRGSAEQYIWQSYYMLEDTLNYDTPQVVVFNVQSLQFNESQSEAYNRMTLEGMKWSSAKVKSILASMKEDEKFLDYVFPILRYHTRWSELTADDFKYMFSGKKVTHNGYYMRVDVKPAENVPVGRMLSDYSFGDNAWKYLDKMVELCEQKGITLILIKAPSLYPYWYDEWDAQIKDYAEEKELLYINFLQLIDEIGIDYNTDTYDAGLHMNLSGAEKLSVYLGRILSEELNVPDRRNEDDISRIWEQKIIDYESEIEVQYEYYGINKE